MRPTNWRAMCILLFFCFVAVIVICTRFGGCETQIETAMGGSVPMKCHWTFQAIRAAAIGGLGLAVMGFTCDGKVSRRIVGVLAIVIPISLSLIATDFGIGLCGDAAMHCHTTAHGVWIACFLAVIIGLVMVVLADPEKKNLPKKSL